MEYEFYYISAKSTIKATAQHHIRLIHAPLLLDDTLVQIAHVMEEYGRIQGQQFRICSIVVRSDYQPHGSEFRLIPL
ncbi:hypothetical protein SAMN02910455_01780 [Acidaminococcus fermentans]|nr:hypothetical protein SAMN02910455_01780 [Acidaminococcus fermentans]